MDSEESSRKTPWLILVCLGTEENHKETQDSVPLGRESNPGSLKYEAGVSCNHYTAVFVV
jgi:hypothetical protein